MSDQVTHHRKMIHRALRLAVCTMLLLAIGCGADEDAHSGEEDPTTLPAITLEHRLTVDDQVALFGSIRAVVADDVGRMYVADNQYLLHHEIVVISPDGMRLGTIGGRGEGPGEFESLVGLTWVGQRLLAMDVRSQRFTFFEPDGEVVRTWTWEWTFLSSATPPLMSGGGTGYALVEAVSAREQGLSTPEAEEYLIFRDDGTVDVVPRVAEPETGPSVSVCVLLDGGFRGGPLPYFDRGPLRAFLPDDRVAFGHREAFRIDIVDIHTHKVVQILRRPYPRVPVTEEDWESQPEIRFFRDLAREAGSDLVDRDRGGPCASDDLRPEFLPVLRTLISDDAGRLWVESTAPDGDGFSLTLYDSDGTLIGETRMPDRDPDVLPHVRADRLYLVTVDSLGVQSIGVYSLRLPQ